MRYSYCKTYIEVSSITLFFRTFDDYTKLQELLDVTDGFTTLPNASMRDTFDGSIRQSQNNISNIFFGRNPDECHFGDITYSTVRNQLASLLVTKSVSKVKIHFYLLSYFLLYSLFNYYDVC